MDGVEQILSSIVEDAKYYVEALGKKVTLAVSDREKYIFYFEGKVRLGLGVGKEMRPGSASDKVLKTGIRSTVLVPAERFGIPFIDGARMLEEIKSNILDTASMIDETAASSQEQSAAIEEIASLITDMGRMIGDLKNMANDYDFIDD